MFQWFLSNQSTNGPKNKYGSMPMQTYVGIQNLALADPSTDTAVLRMRYLVGVPQIYHRLPRIICNPRHERESQGGEISSGFYTVPDLGGPLVCNLATGNRGPGRMQFQSPSGIAFHYGRQVFYVADTANCRLQRLTPDLEFPGVLCCPTDDPEVSYEVAVDGTYKSDINRRGINSSKKFRPISICISRDGEQIFITDSDSNHIRVISPDGVVLKIILAGFRCPTLMTIDMQDFLYVYDEHQGEIVKLSTSGQRVWTLNASQFQSNSHVVEALCILDDNLLLVVLRDDYMLRLVDTTGTILGMIRMATLEHGTTALARGPNGGFVIGSSRSCVDIYTRSGDLISSVFAPSPAGIAFDDDGFMLVVCGYDHAVRRYSVVGK